MDQYFYYEDFASFAKIHPLAWCKFLVVRVEFVWEDVEQGKLYIILLDKNRDKMAVVVPNSILHFYTQQNLLGGVFALEHFQVGATYYQYPRYEKYSLVRDELIIEIGWNTRFIPLTSDIRRDFVFYPLVPSIQAFQEDRTRRKMLIDVVGKIIKGGRTIYRDDGFIRVGSCDLFLQDATGYIIKLRLYDTNSPCIWKITRAIKNQSLFYASRVKLIHLNTMNVLSSTDLTMVKFDPDMLEAHYIRLMLT